MRRNSGCAFYISDVFCSLDPHTPKTTSTPLSRYALIAYAAEMQTPDSPVANSWVAWFGRTNENTAILSARDAAAAFNSQFILYSRFTSWLDLR